MVSAQPALAWVREQAAPSKPVTFSERLDAARTACFVPGKPYGIRLKQLSGDATRKQYTRHFIPEASFKLTVKETTLNIALTPQSADFRDLAADLRQFSAREGYTTLQKACAAACLTDHLISGAQDIESNRSMGHALREGAGDCKHFAVITDYLLDHSASLHNGVGASWIHAFNWVKDEHGEELIFDAMLAGDEFCTFYSASK